ncbi:MAG: hypothetical protein Tsb0034_28080 [Ekhidna sp.]
MIYRFLHQFRFVHNLSRSVLTNRFLPFKIAFNLFSLFSFKIKVRRAGAKVTIPIHKGVGAMNLISSYEPWLLSVLHTILEKEKGAFIDVGANVGQTLLKVMPYFPNTKYIAIEPNPSCISYLKKLCQLNEFQNVRLLASALADVEGEAELQIRFKDDLLATTTKPFRKYTKYANSLKVKRTTGDKLMMHEKPEDISIIKIDVEGGEAMVISGLVDTIRHHQPILLIEILPLDSKDEGVAAFRKNNAETLLSSLQNLQYELYNLQLFNRIVATHDLSKSLESANYIAFPKAKKGVLDQLKQDRQ